MRHLTSTGFATLLITIGLLSPADASIIGVNFYGRLGEPVAGEAGAPGYEQMNWNNALAEFSVAGNLTGLADDAGTPTTAGVSYNPRSRWSYDQTPNSPNQRLMSGWLEALNNDPEAVDFTSIPYSSYDVVVYFDGEGNPFDQTMAFTIGTEIITTTDAANLDFFGSNSNGGLFVEATSSNSFVGNYAVFSGLTSSDFTLTFEAISGDTLRGRLNAIQIVQTQPQTAAVPEPSSVAIWALGLIGCAGYTYRKRRRKVA